MGDGIAVRNAVRGVVGDLRKVPPTTGGGDKKPGKARWALA